ncbi:hypothetical protein DFP72DRAFT_848852 [Ephemerocybe angulata]|uniref:Uncharacterized protein n=1 Tax=Ephemerocybe angulata TaxID=980116 RepID=A0A8H6M385_9AGAR|nr:hypothetical protein DFP72DRAFT_848852 [Tulosesus angulatus]
MKTHDVRKIFLFIALQVDINSVTDTPYFAIPRYRYTLLRHPESHKLATRFSFRDICHVGVREEIYFAYRGQCTTVRRPFLRPPVAHQIHFYTYFVILDRSPDSIPDIFCHVGQGEGTLPYRINARLAILHHPEGATQFRKLGRGIAGCGDEFTSRGGKLIPSISSPNLSSFDMDSSAPSSQTHFSCDFAILQVSQAPGPYQRWDATQTASTTFVLSPQVPKHRSWDNRLSEASSERRPLPARSAGLVQFPGSGGHMISIRSISVSVTHEVPTASSQARPRRPPAPPVVPAGTHRTPPLAQIDDIPLVYGTGEAGLRAELARWKRGTDPEAQTRARPPFV